MALPQTAQSTWRQFFFSPTGRFTRAQYWGATLSVLGLTIVYFIPAAIWVPEAPEAWSILQTVYILLGVCLGIAMFVVNSFAVVKRFHDRDKPWPWFFISFAPYIGGLWIFIECGCLSGKPGRNRYGPDPRNPEGDIVDVFDGPSAGSFPRPTPEPRFAPDLDPRADRSA